MNKVIMLIVIIVVCFPITIVTTLISSSFWEWLEKKTNIEAYGHFGPAEWCYLVIYLILLTVCILKWLKYEYK